MHQVLFYQVSSIKTYFIFFRAFYYCSNQTQKHSCITCTSQPDYWCITQHHFMRTNSYHCATKNNKPQIILYIIF